MSRDHRPARTARRVGSAPGVAGPRGRAVLRTQQETSLRRCRHAQPNLIGADFMFSWLLTGGGLIQRQVKRAFAVRPELTTAALAEWVYPHGTPHRRQAARGGVKALALPSVQERLAK